MKVASRTSMRVTEETIDRLRDLARRKSVSAPNDLSWAAVGREILERALLEEEWAFGPPQLA
jgi:hypothetical protein